MRLLLDSHILVAVAEHKSLHLPIALLAVLSASGTNVFVSTASLWELEIKFRLGKLKVDVGLELLPRFLKGAGVALLPIRESHLFAGVLPEPPTKDPFDRLLLGVCKAEEMQLVTMDRALADHPLAWRAIPSG